MKYYLGLDSGGTKTETAIVAEDGAFVANTFGGPIQFHQRRAPKTALAMVNAFIEQATADAKIGRGAIAFYGFGMSGIDFADEIPLQTRTLLKGVGVDPRRAKVVNDGVVALWGGTPAPRAVILQLGTAFTAAYRDGLGTEEPFDQYNAGVVLDVRRLILASCARVWDGRLPASALADLVMRHFGIDDALELIRQGTRDRLDRWLLLTVIDPWREAVERGDALALDILERAANVYAADVHCLLAKVGGQADVVLGGGLLRNGPTLFRDRIAALVRDKYPGAAIHLPELSPAIGAALMAAFGDGADYPRMFARAKETAR
jgi:N-acetylglucosamine kinase-like BadF-type ATPase